MKTNEKINFLYKRIHSLCGNLVVLTVVSIGLAVLSWWSERNGNIIGPEGALTVFSHILIGAGFGFFAASVLTWMTFPSKKEVDK